MSEVVSLALVVVEDPRGMSAAVFKFNRQSMEAPKALRYKYYK
jgi:hypothetical protein